jgi:hypothetical protein
MGRVQTSIDKLGPQLEAAERHPQMVFPLTDLEGFNSRAIEKVNEGSREPFANIDFQNKEDEKILAHAKKMGAQGNLADGATHPKTLGGPRLKLRGQPDPTMETVTPSTFYKTPPDAKPGSDVYREWLRNNTYADGRYLGNVQRDEAQAATPIIQARLEGRNLTPAEQVGAQTSANLAKRINEILNERSAQLGTDRQGINRQLSELFTIQDSNKLLKGGGGLFGSPGQMGARGGLGAGVGQNLVQIGAPTGTRGLLGSAAIALLHPGGVSRLGNAAANLAELSPSLFWLYNAYPSLRGAILGEPTKKIRDGKE